MKSIKILINYEEKTHQFSWRFTSKHKTNSVAPNYLEYYGCQKSALLPNDLCVYKDIAIVLAIDLLDIIEDYNDKK